MAFFAKIFKISKMIDILVQTALIVGRFWPNLEINPEVRTTVLNYSVCTLDTYWIRNPVTLSFLSNDKIKK